MGVSLGVVTGVATGVVMGGVSQVFSWVVMGAVGMHVVTSFIAIVNADVVAAVVKGFVILR